MDDWLYSQVLDDFADSMYDGGGEANRGGYCGGSSWVPPTYYKVSGEFVRETDKAICIYYDGWQSLTKREEMRLEWFPKSQIHDLKVGDVTTFECPDWLLNSKSSDFNKVQKKCEEVGKTTGKEFTGWLECDECETDQFNILEYKDRYHIQCANCGAFKTLRKCK